MQPLVLVTYRNREVHLDAFLLYMNRYFPDLRIAICEQSDRGPWNKGLLFNAGYREFATDYEYLILHDIDFLPSKNVNYSYCPVPTLLSTECSQFGYEHAYNTFFGGVVGMTKDHYELVNGFSNQFTGYGGEDDLFYRSFIAKGITPAKRLGNRFECFDHPRPKDNLEYTHNLRILEAGRDFSEGLSTALYRIVSKNEFPQCLHLRINTTNQ